MTGTEAATLELADVPEVRRLVGAIAAILDDTPPRLVLAGGLAVMARLATVHRATSDVDLVVGDRAGMVERLSALPNARVDDRPIRIDDVQIDLIEVDPTVTWEAMAELHVDDPDGFVFVVAHRFIFQDAAPVQLSCGPHRARVPTGSARSLLVAKLGAYLSPRRDAAKVSSDALDLWRLLEVCRVGTARRRPGYQLDVGVVPVVAQAGREMLHAVRDDPTTLRKRIRQFGVTPSEQQVREQCAAVAALLPRPG